MQTTILDASDAGTHLDGAIDRLAAQIAQSGKKCVRLRLNELRYFQCTGCFDCWLKTPGQCRLRDQGSLLVAAAAHSDLVIFAAPMRMGFTCARLKRATDRLLPTLLPYVVVVRGECHHQHRYGRGFDIALLIEPGDSTELEVAATQRIYERLALNVGGVLLWVKTAGQLAMEAEHALDAA
jgi:multimeric flavodoxin WrbA